MYSVGVKRLGFRPSYFCGMRHQLFSHMKRYIYHLDTVSYRTLCHAAYGVELLPRIQEIIWETEDDDVYPYIRKRQITPTMVESSFSFISNSKLLPTCQIFLQLHRFGVDAD